MKRIRSKPQDSPFPLRLALPPPPPWRRSRPRPDPNRGRPEAIKVELRLVRPHEGAQAAHGQAAHD